MPRTRPYSKLMSFHIKDYQNNVYWDGLGTYVGTNSNPTSYSSHYDDTSNQNTMVWKCMIDLSDYGSGNTWENTTFKLGIRVKSSSNQAYIYGNATGQFIFKVTELAKITSNDGTAGGKKN